MKKEFRNRYMIVGIVFIAIMAVLAVRLFQLQFVEGEDHLNEALTFSRKELRLTGPRGKILDRNGLPLAYNKTSYSVQFVRDPSKNKIEDRAAYTKSIMKAMKIIEDNNGKFISTFAIRKMEDGSYDFYWPGVDKVEKAKLYEERVKKWKGENCSSAKKIYSTGTPEEIFMQSREYYFIPQDASYEDAFKILSVWQEVRSTFYASYIPIRLAQDVSMKTVAMIETDLIDMPGMQISQSSSRVYPNKSMAAHIIGYMGSMQDEQTMVDLGALGYRRDDLIGISGIELTQEAELTGNIYERSGRRVVEVNNLGKVNRELEDDNRSPKPGNNVVLTLDSKLQKRLEIALQENIAQIRAAQDTKYREEKDKYDLYLQERVKKEIQYAEVGAAVVMDVQTGEILAMASYPSFDLNIFAGWLSQTDFDTVYKDPRNPLFNNAVSSRGTPGSVFKLVTGLAGLMEGQIALETQIDDEGYYNKHVAATSSEKGPSCWVRPYFHKHDNQTIVEAIKDSCNYFFFEVADRLKIDRLNKWASMLGLADKTNVELPNEVKGQIGSQASLYSKDNMSGVAALVRKQIAKLMKDACVKSGLEHDDEKYMQVALQMMDLVNSGIEQLGTDIRAILKNELKLTSANITKYNLAGEISMSLSEIKWNGNFTIETGIGQSVTLLTPIAMARYISALVNGGDVFEARLVKAVITPEGEVIAKQPKLIRNLGAPEVYLQAIKAGMSHVVSEEEGGTAAESFKNFKYKDKIGGKTGTAEVSQTIDLENNSWFVAFAPFDEPEIAVVVYIPSGYQGALSSHTAKEIIEYYLDMKYMEKTQEEMPQVNSLVK